MNYVVYQRDLNFDRPLRAAICSRFDRRRRSTSAKMPVVFKQELPNSEADCAPRHRLSSWAFLSFMIAITNAVINISNNVNNNLNNNNNNNNQNNNNQVRDIVSRITTLQPFKKHHKSRDLLISVQHKYCQQHEQSDWWRPSHERRKEAQEIAGDFLDSWELRSEYFRGQGEKFDKATSHKDRMAKGHD